MYIFVIYFLVGMAVTYGLPNNSSKASYCRLSAYPPDPKSQCCGIDTAIISKIVGGRPTDIHQYPWLVLLEYKIHGYNTIQTRCGGILISGRYVLTAAHCVAGNILSDSKPVNIRLGDYDKTHEGPDCVTIKGKERDCNDGAIRIPIERIITHPGYNANVFKNDIALIRLKKMAPYTDFIRPVCLPVSDVTAYPPANLRLYAAGWGIAYHIKGPAGQMTNIDSRVKQHVDLPYMNYQQCKRAWGTLFWEKQICAGAEAGKDSCMGDSGGPLMHEHNGMYDAVGVVSFGAGAPCGKKGIPGVYTKVFEYLPWIKSLIRE